MRQIKVVSGFLLALASFLGLSPTAQARTYRIGMIHWIAYSPLNVADVKGLFKQEGLDVKVINFSSNQELNTALQNKRIDIAIDMMGSWVGMSMAGVPLTILGETDWSNGGDKIIAKKNVDPTKLKGKDVGVYLNQPSVTFFLGQYLKKIGLRLSDVKVKELDPTAMTDNFIANRFNVIVNYDPQALRAERKGNGKVVATSASWPGVIPEGFVSHTQVFKSIPEKDLAGIFRAWVKAVKWTKDAKNWKEYMKILNAKTFEGEPPYSEADLKGMVASVKVHPLAEQLKRNQNGGGLMQYLGNLRAFLKENGLLKKDFQPNVLFNNKVIVQTLSGLK